MALFTKGRDRRAMQELSRAISARSNQPLWGWIDSQPSPSLTIDRSGPERVLITVQEGRYVLYMDDGAQGSIPQKQSLGEVGSAVGDVIDRFVATLRHYGRDLHARGDQRFHRFIMFDMQVAETFADNEGELDALRVLSKAAYDSPPDNPTTLNRLIDSAESFGATKLQALLRATQGRSELMVAQRGDDPRFTYSGARGYFELALELIETIPGGFDDLRDTILKTMRAELPQS